ncbi:uncharacterized protein LACBIDRAFT_318126 [Laccaria bicolor S238N-H82]|uniref:Predicted protein n=1 Tax=Laccaria bicolor (strain S238N-H82 / ATCC MYA-4686) TaxID=486041 RepID=B0D621_LACBS|nr:uncharacterized protein LACBIDRAFT_318126 [Laccaria bicolor S238N-H82]EDR10121.1 predicted protein [Laccaria bicolor S238N-H82]|eukprot:XP_001879506.1 predicted protein [Laccaria bicolor S238N-H82]
MGHFLVFETDPNWKPDPKNFSNCIHVPPIWEVDPEGNREWYIPPPGCRPSRPTSHDFDDPHPVSAITFSSVAPSPGCPAYVPAPISIGATPFSASAAGASFTIASGGAPSTSTSATTEAEKSADHEEAAKTVDLRTTGYFREIWNQGRLGSCAPHAVAGAFTFVHQKQLDSQVDHFEPSRLFIHYNMRAMYDEVDKDNGGTVFEGLLSVSDKGVCPEEDWKYLPWGSHVPRTRGYVLEAGSRATVQPSDLAYERALEHTVTEYVQLAVNKNSGTDAEYDFDLDVLRKCLDDGYPFVFGCHAFRNAIAAGFLDDGTLKAPKDADKGNGSIGHALMGVGYDDTTQCFTIRNSWGPTWNGNGCFMMPYDIIAHPRVAYDFCTIRKVKE